MNDFKTTFEKDFRYLIENHYPDLSADDLLSLTVVNVSEDQKRIEVITPKSINSNSKLKADVTHIILMAAGKTGKNYIITPII